MKLTITKFLIPILLISSCQNQEKKLREYGYAKNQNDILKVSLNLREFKAYGEFIDRIHEVTCNDSIPKIVVETGNITRNLYPTEYCEPSLFDPEGRHYVTFRDGTAYYHQTSQEINLDMLTQKLLSDFAYYNSSNSTEKPDSYFIIIESMRDQKTAGIEQFINALTTNYDSLKTDAVLNLAFWEEMRHPPPPPAELDTILTE